MFFETLMKQATVHVPPELLVILSSLVAVWVIWRIWRFTVSPYIWSNEPNLLPYWIPFVGHTVAFVRNPETLIDNGFKYFGSNSPFALTVAGRRTVVLRDVQDVAGVWRNTADLSYDPFVTDLFSAFGISKPTVKKVYDNPHDLVPEELKASSLLITDNPSNKGYQDLERDWFKTQLVERDSLQHLLNRYGGFLRQSLSWDDLSSTYVSASDADRKSKTVSLKVFCRYTLSYCSSNTFFGTKLLETSPDFLSHYQDWEEESWKIFFRLPQMFARESHASKDRALDRLEKYLSLPDAERGELTWLFRTMLHELRCIEVPTRDIAGIVMIIIWAINNNAHKICFWMLGHMLHDPDLMASVQSETDAAFASSPEGDVSVLLDSCPHLDALWHETLRLYNASSTVRQAVSPCSVRGKQLQVGDNVVAPFRQFHLQRGIFGADAHAFRPARFLKDAGLARRRGYAPFGGGHTYCPGRLFARAEIYLFIATTLWRYDIDLDPQTPPQRLPPISGTPSAAAIDPAHDVQMRMRPRQHDG